MSNYHAFVNVLEFVSMAGYSFCRQVEMIFTYGHAHGNGSIAAQLYQETSPDQKQPNC
jgi:hypothetical protein